MQNVNISLDKETLSFIRFRSNQIEKSDNIFQVAFMCFFSFGMQVMRKLCDVLLKYVCVLRSVHFVFTKWVPWPYPSHI